MEPLRESGFFSYHQILPVALSLVQRENVPTNGRCRRVRGQVKNSSAGTVLVLTIRANYIAFSA